MSDESRPLICIFAKAPVAGQVKTRLAAGIGAKAARDVYERMLRRVVLRLQRPGWQLELWVTPDDSVAHGALWPAGPRRVGQGPGDLGARMTRCLARATEVRPVILVGSDIPDLGADQVDRALAALSQGRIVFGPSGDGGFYLVGLRGACPRTLFRNVPWSAPDTLARAVESCGAGPVALIDTLDDLDDLAALERRRETPDWADLLGGGEKTIL